MKPNVKTKDKNQIRNARLPNYCDVFGSNGPDSRDEQG